MSFDFEKEVPAVLFDGVMSFDTCPLFIGSFSYALFGLYISPEEAQVHGAARLMVDAGYLPLLMDAGKDANVRSTLVEVMNRAYDNGESTSDPGHQKWEASVKWCAAQILNIYGGSHGIENATKASNDRRLANVIEKVKKLREINHLSESFQAGEISAVDALRKAGASDGIVRVAQALSDAIAAAKASEDRGKEEEKIEDNTKVYADSNNTQG